MEALYNPLLTAHSLLRWLVLVLAVLAVLRAAVGLGRKQPWRPWDDKLGLGLMVSVDLQVLLGVVLWLHYLGRAGFDMANAASRQLLLEHPLTMLVALVLVHVGRVRVKRQDEDAGRFKTVLVFYGLALVLILIMIPWDRLGL